MPLLHAFSDVLNYISHGIIHVGSLVPSRACGLWLLFRLAADEVEHGAIEDLRLLPVGRVPGLGHQHHPAVRNLGRDHSRDRRRGRHVRSAGDQQRRQLELLELRLRDLIPERLPIFGADQRLVLELHPRLHAGRIRRSV
jgi:hypothetical protein